MREVVLAEFLQAWRGALRRPAYLIIASLTLSLGIAACVAVFALMRASLFTDIAVPDIARVAIVGPLEGEGSAGGVSPIQYQHLIGLEGVSALGVAAPARSSVTILNGDRPVSVASWQVSDGFLAALDMPMALGRRFSADESRPHGPAVMILSHGYWQDVFAGRADIIGRTVQINGRSVEVIGVLPPDFPFHDAALLLPLTLQPNDPSWSGSYTVLARLDPQASPAAVAAAAEARMGPLSAAHGMDRFAQQQRYVAQPLEQALRANTGARDVLLLFMACAVVVLLIVLVNLSNLALLRILSRSHDSAVRQALGAGTLRVLLPTLAEQCLIALVGGSAGLALAWAALRVSRSLIPPTWFVAADTTPTIGTVGITFALGLATLTVMLAILIGSVRSRTGTLSEALIGGGRGGAGRSVGRVGKLLVVLQAAMATVLLIVSALCARTLWNASQVDYGFDGGSVVAFSLKPDRETYPDQQAVLNMSDALTERLRALPGAVGVGYGTNLPASGTDHNDTAPYDAEGGVVLESIASYLISPSYFDALGIGLQRGHPMSDTHAANSDTAVVSARLQATAPGQAQLDQTLSLPLRSVNPAFDNMPLRVQGVVNDVRAYGPNYEAPPIVWIPFSPRTANLYEVWRDADSLFFAVKVQGDPNAFLQQVQSAANEVVPTLPLNGLRPFAQYQAAHLDQQRLNLTLVLVFAGVALLLSSVGMYSVMAVNVASRRQELGVRAALGAPPKRLLQHVLFDGLIQIGIGLLIGIVTAIAASGVLKRLVFGMAAIDVTSILSVLVLLTCAGIGACLLPAVRAARSDPMQALRQD